VADAVTVAVLAGGPQLVRSEIDFDSTLLGGSDLAINAVLNHPRLEALALDGYESLMPFADQVNT